MAKRPTPVDGRVPDTVPGDGWMVVAQLKGTLPVLHRQDVRARSKAGTIVTRCGLYVRHVYDVPTGTTAHLCKDCR